MKHARYIFLALTFMVIEIHAQAITTNIDGDTAEIFVSLPGDIAADFTLTFDEVIGLTETNLGITAELVNINDVNLLSRLPDSLLTSIPAAFPMMITVEPLFEAGFSFSGSVTIDIHTHNLPYVLNTPLRLFKAPLGGPFKDITDTTSSGSYRARGDSGSFSQFLVIADNRPTSQVVSVKLAQLQADLASWQSLINPSTFLLLDSKVTGIEEAINKTDFVNAQILISEFLVIISQNSGTQIPDIWRSSRDIVNVAGELAAAAKTLKYSIRIL